MVRNSLKFVSYKDRKRVASGLKRIYTGATEEAALEELKQFCTTWDARYSMIGKS